ncbi:MAG: response regulator transcription factor [Spirochaetota bacterium]
MHPTLILVDSLFLDPPATLYQLEQLPGPLGSHVMVALMNMAKNQMVEVRAVTLGVRGLFYANSDLDFLVKGVVSMFEGEVWVPRRVLADAISADSSGSDSSSQRVAELLTRRERQILALISTGSSNDEIAARLNISTNTVRTHVYNLYRKINVPNRMQAVLWGAEHL